MILAKAPSSSRSPFLPPSCSKASFIIINVLFNNTSLYVFSPFPFSWRHCLPLWTATCLKKQTRGWMPDGRGNRERRGNREEIQGCMFLVPSHFPGKPFLMPRKSYFHPNVHYHIPGPCFLPFSLYPSEQIHARMAQKADSILREETIDSRIEKIREKLEEGIMKKAQFFFFF